MTQEINDPVLDDYSNDRVKHQNESDTKKPSKLPLIFAILACTVGSSMQIGVNTAILNSPQDVIKDFFNETYFDRNGKHMESSLLTLLWSLAVAAFPVGGMVGGATAGYFANKFGRKNSLLANNVVAIICAALQGFSKTGSSYEMLIVGRVVAGWMCGLISAVAPLYLAEISPLSLTGFCGTCNQLLITLGVLISEILGLSKILGTEGDWPYLVALPAVPAVISFMTLTFCPETPKYLLVFKGDDSAAEKALVWLRGTPDVEEEVEEMRKERIELRNSPKFSIGDLFKTSELRKPLIICAVLQMSQQLSGINAVIYYSTSIFESAGLSEYSSQIATIGVGVVNVSMTFVSALIMDRAGRRTLHMTGLGGMCIFSLMLVICLKLQDTASWLSYLSIVSVVLYIVFFATGPGAIPWFMVAELFSQGPRSAAVSVSVLVNWFCNFLVGITYPLLENAINSYSFLPFVVMLALFFIFTYFYVPETKGKSITEITLLFKDPADITPAGGEDDALLSTSSVQNTYGS